jgi:hypothetical protein
MFHKNFVQARKTGHATGTWPAAAKNFLTFCSEKGTPPPCAWRTATGTQLPL